MARYRIVSARPKGATNHINSEFKIFLWDEVADQWAKIGWQSIDEVSGLLQAGHEVLTGNIENGKMASGAAVELELRIARNDTKYRISDMPDT